MDTIEKLLNVVSDIIQWIDLSESQNNELQIFMKYFKIHTDLIDKRRLMVTIDTTKNDIISKELDEIKNNFSEEVHNQDDSGEIGYLTSDSAPPHVTDDENTITKNVIGNDEYEDNENQLEDKIEDIKQNFSPDENFDTLDEELDEQKPPEVYKDNIENSEEDLNVKSEDTENNSFVPKSENEHNSDETNVIYRCVFCQADFPCSQDLNEHDIMHHKDGNEYLCGFKGCNFVEIEKKEVVEHYLVIHQRILHKCPDCGECFTTTILLNDHIKQNHKNTNCKHCSITFRTPTELKRHMIVHEDPVICTECGKTFKNEQCRKAHQRVYHENGGLKRLTCPTCGLELVHTAYDNHVARHNVTEKTVPCSQCDRKFYTEKDMQIHMNGIHFKAKPSPCDICGSILSSPRALRLHQLIHSDEKQVDCPHCDMKFKHKSFLKSHLKNVAAPKGRFKCTVCSKGFKYRYGLVAHMKIHNEDYDGECQVCGKKFIQGYNLKLHIERHHPELNKENP